MDGDINLFLPTTYIIQVHKQLIIPHSQFIIPNSSLQIPNS